MAVRTIALEHNEYDKYGNISLKKNPQSYVKNILENCIFVLAHDQDQIKACFWILKTCKLFHFFLWIFL